MDSGVPDPGPSSDLLARLRADEPTFLLGVRAARTTDVVRIARATGHHGIFVDLEHSTMGLDVAAALCTTADDLGLAALVRVPEREYGDIGRLLDGAATGIVAPRIETAEEATTLARACHSPELDDAILVQVIIETPAGVENADRIAAVDGVGMVAIGANDLTAELGVPGEYGHPALRDAVAAAGRACRAHGKPLMLGGVGDPAVFATFVALGVAPLHLTGFDTNLLFAAAAGRVAALNQWYQRSDS